MTLSEDSVIQAVMCPNLNKTQTHPLRMVLSYHNIAVLFVVNISGYKVKRFSTVQFHLGPPYLLFLMQRHLSDKACFSRIAPNFVV